MNTRDLKLLATAVEAEQRAVEASGRLSDAARAVGLLDVAIGTVDSPLGSLLVAVTPKGLARVAYPGEEHDEVLTELASALSPRILESAAGTDEIRRELEQYFSGKRHDFDIDIDWGLVHGFALRTLRAVRRVPFGEVTTYSALAERVGAPRGARAVGNALGSNPIPIVVPCHRVLRSDGSLGGYSGGIQRKVELLALESASGATASDASRDPAR